MWNFLGINLLCTLFFVLFCFENFHESNFFWFCLLFKFLFYIIIFCGFFPKKCFDVTTFLVKLLVGSCFFSLIREFHFFWGPAPFSSHKCDRSYDRASIHTYKHTYMHTYTHTYMHTYIHVNIHMQKCWLKSTGYHAAVPIYTSMYIYL